jgi:iron-sulfur cluster repair protein YtfE (RIC family)
VATSVVGRPTRTGARFAEDHRRLEGVLGKLAAAWQEHEAPRAKRLMQQLRRGLIQHMRAEDDIIFPTFEAKTGLLGDGPTRALRREHVQLARRLDELVMDLRRPPERSGFTQHFSSLRALLADHWSREENVLYPSCDQLFEEFQHVAAVKALQNKRRV